MTATNIPEMGRHLRQLVDNSLEEGQFESAITMLDMLRSPAHNPAIIHILHLIFIALHPVKETQLNEEEQTLDPKSLLTQSPRKIIKHTKASLVISSSAVLSAQQLLMSFLFTNGPQPIGEALPCYPESKHEPPMEFPFGESKIFAQATAVKHSKNCWEVMKSTFKARPTHLLGSPKPKGKRVSSRLRIVEPSSADLVHGEGEDEHVQVVADSSWFFLEWIVSLFERDAAEMEKSGNQTYSPLLLKQLPPPPIDSTARWDASEPLKVVFYAFEQQDLRRQRSGARLLKLLINLTQTPHLNLPSFVSTVLAQLTTPPPPPPSNTSPITPVSPSPSSTGDHFTTLFKHLPSTPPALSFKLALCKKIIEDAADAPPSDSSRRPSATGFGVETNLTRDAFISQSASAASRSKRSTMSPTVSGATKPKRAQPRARVKTTTTTTLASEGSASIDDNAPNSPTILISRSPSNSNSGNPITTTTTTTTTTASSSSPTYVARCPSYLEVVQLSRTTFPFFTFSFPHLQQQQQRQPEPPSGHSSSRLTNKPWASSSLLTRVKFELLLAYILVQIQRREWASFKNLFDSPDASFSHSLADGSFAALLDEAFAPLGSNEDEDRVVFRQLLYGVVGLPPSSPLEEYPDLDSAMEL